MGRHKKNEVFEMKKAEIREEQAMQEGRYPQLDIIDDVSELATVKEDAMVEEEPEAPPKLKPKKLTADEEAQLIADLTATLKVPKTKDAIMVFSMYTIGDFNRRYFLLDVDGVAYRRAWAMFKERTGTTDSVRFLGLVNQILNTDMPRLHRAVDWVPLT